MGVFTGNPIITITLLCCMMVDARRNIRTNVCKWCDSSQPVCDGGICLTNCSLSSYCEDPEEICVSIWKQDNYSVKVSSLCHHPQLLVESIQVTSFNSSMCLMKAVPSETFQLYVCGCIHEPECNDKLIFHNQTNEYSILQSREVIPIAAISLLPPLLVAITITVVFYLYRTQSFILRSKDWLKKTNHNTEMVLETSRGDDYNYKLSSVMITDPHPNMSSACANTINHNTELLPIELDQRVGKGRFAEVWRAKLKHATSGQYEVVAVKIFPCQEYSSWVNESQIYADDNLKHDNVLQFITAEDRGSNMQKEYWIITAYQFRGNLKDYLSNHMLSWTTFLKMAGSVVSGVAHLHSDFTPYGTPKIPIAHRDIKSTNILVKNNYECVLCDFGIALRLDPSLTADDFANSGQVGTARYMAPEVLESRVNLEDLESFKQMDVYSLALVLWELGSRCEASGEVRSYELPFGSMVREQPCVETMRNVVLHGRGRPDIPQGWIRHPGLEILSDTITDCWDHDPEARLTAHCVAERINLMSQLDWANNNIRTVD
ncbi:TGF-beta receptor type-2-like [Bombina bombina]|uniref:TGF-beta receptor type-2-like n=1 Tax=Bombina bombina TaxID=8345 RepID=UPI00235A66B7|nr:TGF-beta receptor type-2-like [Bombina bombina]